MRRRGFDVVTVATALVLAAGVADAHRAQLKSNVFQLSGGHANGFLVIKPSRGGRIDLNMPALPPGAKLVIDYRLNGTPVPGVQYPISSSNQTWPLGFATLDQDKLELNDIRIVDQNGATIGVLGTDQVTRGRDVFAAPLVWVVDTMSDVGFTRGGDTVLSRKGEWSVGFDALRSRSTNERLNNIGNRAEIEMSVNDGPFQVHSVTFDVVSGKSRPRGRPGLYVGTGPGGAMSSASQRQATLVATAMPSPTSGRR